jgi:hypothetical protein
MLIKYYSPTGSIHLIENVSDVAIIPEPDHEQYKSDAWDYFDFDQGPTIDKPTVVSFGRDGACARAVRGYAYICNDEGKTLEKVIGR